MGQHPASPCWLGSKRKNLSQTLARRLAKGRDMSAGNTHHRGSPPDPSGELLDELTAFIRTLPATRVSLLYHFLTGSDRLREILIRKLRDRVRAQQNRRPPVPMKALLVLWLFENSFERSEIDEPSLEALLKYSGPGSLVLLLVGFDDSVGLQASNTGIRNILFETPHIVKHIRRRLTYIYWSWRTGRW